MPTVLGTTPSACALDQNSPHRFRSRREEMAPAIPTLALFANQSKIDFMH
jgi:hypothetical protein